MHMFATCYRTLLNELLGGDCAGMSPEPEDTDYDYSPGEMEDADSGASRPGTPVVDITMENIDSGMGRHLGKVVVDLTLDDD